MTSASTAYRARSLAAAAHLLTFVLMWTVATHAADPATPESEFQPLPISSDLAGWIIDGTRTRLVDGQKQPVWTVRDGLIECAGGGFGFLRYDRRLGDFAVRLDYRLPKRANSGVGLRSVRYTGRRGTRPSFSGYELQLLEDHGAPADEHCTGSLYRYVAPTANAARPADEWNELAVECVGPKIKVTINGQLVQDIDQRDHPEIANKPLSGYFSLQNHGSPATFRNVRLREIAPPPAVAMKFEPRVLATDLGIGYAVSCVDMNADDRQDIVVVDKDHVICFENGLWSKRTIIGHQTKADNVSLAANDIDGDGRVDFALGADWHPSNTATGGTIQWLSPSENGSDPWQVHPLGEEPTVHRLRWANLDGDARRELVVVPLFGRGSTPPEYAEAPLRILAYRIPADPKKDTWPVEVINADTHVAHNFWPVDIDGDGADEILLASFEGVSLLRRDSGGTWSRTLVGSGNQESSPSRGASEVKLGRFADGQPYIATIEPWHGFQVVVYTPSDPAHPWPPATSAGNGQLWKRHVLDDQLRWGHAVWTANVDDDADEELVIGVRDEGDGTRCGVRIYDPTDGGARWERLLIDPGGVAVEDLTVADLDGDGWNDIVAVGRQTHNLTIYYNQSQ